MLVVKGLGHTQIPEKRGRSQDLGNAVMFDDKGIYRITLHLICHSSHLTAWFSPSVSRSIVNAWSTLSIFLMEISSIFIFNSQSWRNLGSLSTGVPKRSLFLL
jgi:hypothetical protein